MKERENNIINNTKRTTNYQYKASKDKIKETINECWNNGDKRLILEIATELGWIIEDLEKEILKINNNELSYKWALLKQRNECLIAKENKGNSDILNKIFNRNTSQTLKGDDNTYQPIMFLNESEIDNE